MWKGGFRPAETCLFNISMFLCDCCNVIFSVVSRFPRGGVIQSLSSWKQRAPAPWTSISAQSGWVPPPEVVDLTLDEDRHRYLLWSNTLTHTRWDARSYIYDWWAEWLKPSWLLNLRTQNDSFIKWKALQTAQCLLLIHFDMPEELYATVRPQCE